MDRQTGCLPGYSPHLPSGVLGNGVEYGARPGGTGTQYSERLRQEDHELKARLGYRGGQLAGRYLDSLFVHYGAKLPRQAHG